MSGPIHSMTGFARVRKTIDNGELTVSVKTLNHRSLDLHFHVTPDLHPFENAMRGIIKRTVLRGHLEIRIVFKRSQSEGSMSLNRPVVEAYLSAFRNLAKEHGIKAEPDLNVALALPGMRDDAEENFEPEFEAMLMQAMEEAMDSLNGFRAREGAELVQCMLHESRSLREQAAHMLEIRSRALPAYQARLSERLKELLKGASVDPQRLAQEVAVLADRSDIGEELARLKIHAEQVEELLMKGGEVGKKLDFLLQELNREANTILSKTSGIGELGLSITELALASKSNIEKIREQALNLE